MFARGRPLQVCFLRSRDGYDHVCREGKTGAYPAPILCFWHPGDGDWIVYHASLSGSKPENDWWMSRKARTVMLKHHSTMYERVSAEERGVDWYEENNLLDETHAIHGGGLPLITKHEGFVGILLISGLPQVEDHLLGVEVLTEFLARKGEQL